MIELHLDGRFINSLKKSVDVDSNLIWQNREIKAV